MDIVNWQAIRYKLQQVWGYDDFRPPQAEVVANLLARRDSIVILATGSGKSICFQLPAILNQGLTLVISPLLALMDDQVRELKQRKLPVAALHSNLAIAERREILKQISTLRLLYLSPETLLSPPVWEQLCHPNLAIAGIMIDEAHCLVQWGDSFRPAYRRLGAVRSHLMKSKNPDHAQIAIAAFTATADLKAQADLQACLQLDHPQIVRTSPLRTNLSLNVAIAWTTAGRKNLTRQFIQSGQSGLIYVRSRRETEELAAWLQSESYVTAAYHAGLPGSERQEIEQKWLNGTYPFVVCTSAFGLGINKPDVRWVLHFQSPLTLSEYIQEVGRAGRDGKPAQALMLVSEPTGILDNSDRTRQNFFLQEQQKLRQKAQALIPQLPKRGKYAEVSHISTDAAIALGLLHSHHQLIWHTPFEYEILEGNHQLPASDRLPLEQMQNYIFTKQCRWSFLMAAFGFNQEAQNLKCGICDRCLKQNK